MTAWGYRNELTKTSSDDKNVMSKEDSHDISSFEVGDSDTSADMTHASVSSVSSLETIDSPIAVRLRLPQHERFLSAERTIPPVLIGMSEPQEQCKSKSKAQRLKEKCQAIEAWNVKQKKQPSLLTDMNIPLEQEDSGTLTIQDPSSNMSRSARRIRKSNNNSSKAVKDEKARTKRIIHRFLEAETKLKVKQYELQARSVSIQELPWKRRKNQVIQERAETMLRLSQLEAARDYFQVRLDNVTNGNSHSSSSSTTAVVPMHVLKVVSSLQQYNRHNTLQEDLKQAVAVMSDQYPEQMQCLLREIRRRKGSGMEKAALQVGANAPAFLLRANAGTMVDSNALLSKGRLVVTFYHGSWSSLCIIALRALQALHQTLKAEGVALVAIGPESLDATQTTALMSGATFPLLSDTDCHVAHQFGLTHHPLETPLPGRQGPSKNDPLPMLATYVVDTNGVILYSFVNGDLTQRAEPLDILEALPAKEVLRTRRGPLSMLRRGK